MKVIEITKIDQTYRRITLTDMSGEEINANLYGELADLSIEKGTIVAFLNAKVTSYYGQMSNYYGKYLELKPDQSSIDLEPTSESKYQALKDWYESKNKK